MEKNQRSKDLEGDDGDFVRVRFFVVGEICVDAIEDHVCRCDGRRVELEGGSFSTNLKFLACSHDLAGRLTREGKVE